MTAPSGGGARLAGGDGLTGAGDVGAGGLVTCGDAQCVAGGGREGVLRDHVCQGKAALKGKKRLAQAHHGVLWQRPAQDELAVEKHLLAVGHDSRGDAPLVSVKGGEKRGAVSAAGGAKVDACLLSGEDGLVRALTDGGGTKGEQCAVHVRE